MFYLTQLLHVNIFTSLFSPGIFFTEGHDSWQALAEKVPLKCSVLPPFQKEFPYGLTVLV